MRLKLLAGLSSVLLAMTVSCGSGSGNNPDNNPIVQPMDDQGQYLADNAVREGVVTTASGLQYEVVRQAEGAMPGANDIVTVHYRGMLIDGTEFDSSYARGAPATFELGRTISGWVEGVQLMSVGGQYRLVIPSELAYGERGSAPNIPPNAVLIFDIELLEVNSG